MSTRSGKRLHSSFQENVEVVLDESKFHKPDRKTRGKRLKENEEHSDTTLSKSKKRQNYVSYPADDATEIVATATDSPGTKSIKKPKRQILKEQNINVLDQSAAHGDVKKAIRVTRHTRKFAEHTEEDLTNVTASTDSTEVGKTKSKKNKKKRSKLSDVNDNIDEQVQSKIPVLKAVSKKSKKKKKGKATKSSPESVKAKNVLNGSNISTDSFHSAAGSPLVDVQDINEAESPVNKKVNNTFEKTDSKPVSQPVEKIKTPRNSRKSSIAVGSPMAVTEVINDKSPKTQKLNVTVEKTDAETVALDETFEKITSPRSKRKSSVKNATFEKEDSKATTKSLNSTFDKSSEFPKLNSTFDKKEGERKSLILSSSNGESKNISVMNSTFDKSDTKQISLDTTFDKSAPKLNSTFDKNATKIDSGKSSLISSDEGTINVTFDKDNNSRISITSDESLADNIVNTTPVLIESSLDESQLSTSRLSANLNTTTDIQPKETLPVVVLQREGTFTKETEELISSPKTKQSLPTPGNTPFHTSRSSQRSVLNVTRSIEKPARRSTLSEIVPRLTKVMFCSPVNNPTLVQQVKKKVIKSSMKGSNKSFVVEENAPVSRPSARKRSFTHDPAESSRAKRSRLADVAQDKPARARTVSAAAKLPEITPSKKLTPAKPKSDLKRTKLPNFAAIHQNQFSRMESLDECQQRKAKRARKLLTPNGKLNVLERSSPRGTTEQPKPRDSIKKPIIPAKKPQTSANQEPPKLQKLPTLETLQQQQGYTRFGFKIHTDFNPFSIPSQTVENTGKKVKPNVSRKSAPKSMPPTSVQPKKKTVLQSLIGTTRKEAAKQTVMREKSFTSLSGKRDVKRSECRTVIKGVRTNRRFELQMQMRNVD